MALTYLSSAGGDAGSTTCTVTPITATTAGSILVAVIKGSSAQYASGVVDTRGNTWTALTNTPTANTASIWYCVPSTPLTTSDTITATMTGSSISQIGYAEYSGQAASSPVSAIGTASAANIQNITVSGTPASASSLVVGLMTESTAETATASSTWTLRLSKPGASGTSTALDIADKASTGASMSVTFTYSTNSNSAAALVEIAPAGGAALTGTAADPEGITDASTVSATAARSATDPVGVTDSAAASATAARDASDAVGLTDTASTAAAGSRSAGDPVGLTDTASTAAAGSRSAADPVSLTDAVSVVLSRVVTAADLLGLIDRVNSGEPFIVPTQTVAIVAYPTSQTVPIVAYPATQTVAIVARP